MEPRDLQALPTFVWDIKRVTGTITCVLSSFWSPVFEYVQIRFPRKWRGRDGGNWLQRILFRIVNVSHRPCCPITYIFHVWNHACLLLQKGEGRHKGSNPDCSGTVCSPHEKKEGLVSEPWARNAAPSAHRPGRGAAFLQTGVLFFPLLLLSMVVVLLWRYWPLGAKSAVTENTLQIASLIRPAAAKDCFSKSFIFMSY